jgi:hypothetical protein
MGWKCRWQEQWYVLSNIDTWTTILIDGSASSEQGGDLGGIYELGLPPDMDLPQKCVTFF